MQHRVRALQLPAGAGNAGLLHRVIGFAQTGSIDHMQRYAVDGDQFAQGVARGTGDIGHDGPLLPGQRIQQAGLAHIRRTRQHDGQTFPQHRTAACPLTKTIERLHDLGQFAAGTCLFQKLDILFRKVQRRFDEHAQIDQRLFQSMHVTRELAIQRTHGRTCRRRGGGIDQVRHRLRLRQIDAVVQEGALGEFARSCRSCPQFKAAGEQRLQHGGTAVTVQFEHVFAGIGRRRLEPQCNAVIDHGTVAGLEPAEHGPPRSGQSAEHAAGHRFSTSTGHTDHPYSAPSGCGGNRRDGVGRYRSGHRSVLIEAAGRWRLRVHRCSCGAQT